MPTINATPNVGGYLTNQRAEALFTWEDVLFFMGTATTLNLNSTYINTRAKFVGGRSAYFAAERGYLVFDTSTITGVIDTLSLNIYVNSVNDLSYTPDAIVEVVGAPTLAVGLTTSDWLPYSYGEGSSAFSSAGDTWETIPLNATAISRAETENEITLQLKDAYYDYYYYTNLTDPTADGAIEYRHNYASFIPYLEYTLAGYGNTVSGVIAANISKLNNVSTAAISKVIGV